VLFSGLATVLATVAAERRRSSTVCFQASSRTPRTHTSPLGLSVAAGTFAAMNVGVWLPPVLAAVIGALLSPSVGKGLLALAGARARRIMHVPVTGAELYANGVPMDEAQFRSAFAVYQAELDTLPPPGERHQWEMAQQIAASQRLAVIPGAHPDAFRALVTRIKPGSGTGTTTLTQPPLYRAAMGSGCCRLVRSRQTELLWRRGTGPSRKTVR
jgi:hypothetical protein